MGISLSENKLLDLWKTTAKAVSEGVFINEEQKLEHWRQSDATLVLA